MKEPIFTNWQSHHAAKWASEPIRLGHRLHKHPLFSMDALADLIKGYPRSHYALVEMGPQGSPRRLWREGDIGNLSGREVIDAIGRGRMWLNLRDVGKLDRRYKEILDEIFDEVAERVPGYTTFNRTSGILISSPNAQVYYHSDLPGQSLWQLHGKKRVYVYPAHSPFLTPEQLEMIALTALEVGLPFDPAYDREAGVFEITGGEMLHWQLNAPHRVENLNCLNVSMTTEYWTDSIRKSQMMNLGNGILRQKLGITPRSRATTGPAFWAKAALQAVVRRAGLLERQRKAIRPIEFVLDRSNPGHVIDLPKAAE